MRKYDTEAQEGWGDTAAYHDYSEKTKNYTKEKWAEVNAGLMDIFSEFAKCKASGFTVESAQAQVLVSELQEYITANYYNCTNAILAGLGKMYIADERFKKNINKSGIGTAEFVADAIAVKFGA